MSNFFILGMPRCRTTWLTAFLNSSGVFCGHELFSHKELYPEDFWGLKRYEYKGSVDNDARYAKPYLRDLDAPLVVIERDCKDVYNSLIDKYHFNKPKLKSVLYDMHDALQVSKRSADLVIQFKDIDATLEELCYLCMPNIGYDKVKHEIFKTMNISPNNIDTTEFNREGY